MSADRLPSGFEDSSSEELERSMEQEVEGLLELDDLDFNPDGSAQIAADALRAERSRSHDAERRAAVDRQWPSGDNEL